MSVQIWCALIVIVIDFRCKSSDLTCSFLLYFDLTCNTKVIVVFTGDKLIIIFSIFASFFLFLFSPTLTKNQDCYQPPSASVSDFQASLWQGILNWKHQNSLVFFCFQFIVTVLFSVYSISERLCALIQMSVMFRKLWHRRQHVIFCNLLLPWFCVIIWMHSQVLTWSFLLL